MILSTPEERISLLKHGATMKQIESIYISENNIKVVQGYHGELGRTSWS